VNASDLPAPPASVDWVAKGAFPAVKNQGRCGSCWAFATVGTIESAFVIAGNELTTLSEQDLVSCSRPNGCDGGTAGSAYKWIQIHNRGPGASPGRGIPTAQTYPYTSGGNGTAGPCLTGRRDTPVVTLTGYTYVAKADEDALVLPCKHIFHEDCILEWIHNYSSCPNCRRDLAKPAKPA